MFKLNRINLSKFKIEKILKFLISFGLLSLIIIIFSQKIEFTSLDLGRHLENGRVVWHNFKVLFTNFYSYTEPNFSFINHHWFSGVIFYKLYLLGGFKLLSFFNILIILFAFILAFKMAQKKIGFYLSSFLALPVIFLLSERVDIRPEIFSYLFIILTWWIIDHVKANHKYRQLVWLIPIFFLWVNLHIYFFIGLALVAFQALSEFLLVFFASASNFKERFLRAWKKAFPWTKIFIVLSLVSLLNPNTWRGLFYPFNILHNYGYQIAENKTIFYLGRLMVNYNFFIFKFLLVLLFLTWIIDYLITKKIKLFSSFLIIFFSSLALFASRNISLFALASLVLISGNLLSIKELLNKKRFILDITRDKFFSLYLDFCLLLFIAISAGYLIRNFTTQENFINKSFGWGLDDNSLASIEFFKKHNLSGPIFNNYDLGSALIFGLYPQERVFVDNRPEAYGYNFFEEIYKPLQNSPQDWKKANLRYHFNTIFFSVTDSTPWAQNFLHSILNDPQWSLVYFDRYAVILINKNLNKSPDVKDLNIDNLEFRKRLNSLAEQADLRGKFSLAILAQAASQNDLAQVIYQNILFSYPNNRQALTALGSLYANSDSEVDLEAALDYFSRAFRAGEKIPGIYNQEALVYWRLKEYSNAEKSWHSALKIDRNNRNALYYLKQIEILKKEGKLLSDN